MESWHPEKNTLYLSSCDMTISLNDVSSLLGLPITGKSMCQQEGSDVQLTIDLLVDSLGVSHTEAFNEINSKSGASIRLAWLSEQFSGINDNDT